MNKFIVYIIFSIILLSCNTEPKKLFSVLSPQDSGIHFNNSLKDTVGQNILDYLYYYNGGGVAIGDINNDELPDIFFTSNQNQNRLYLNKGNLEFEDITEKAKIGGENDWSTGVTMADVNGDGLLDIYVCAVTGTNGFVGKNELFINNGDLTFTERAEEFGLDFDNYSSSATFFDYDLDGDLDLYLLNHAIHTEESFGKASVRTHRTYESGDKLLRNDNNKFVDVSESAGVFGGANGYGLGLAISDFNQDGYPDIYVSNDFHEDDYYYLNNGNGTFSESLKDYFGHVSKFSMGNDAADINNDGYTDLITLDMLPDDEKVLKSSAGDDNIQLQNLRTKQFGYYYQYARNMVQINQGADSFTEIGFLSNMAATDWSWSALIADYDQDGNQDVFIANGIPKRPNDLDYIKYISNSQIKKKIETTNLIDKEALNYMPDGKLKNGFYQGSIDLKFNNQTATWVTEKASYSTGSAYGDLDNDGDLDLVTNNIGEPATVYINNTNTKKNYLKIQFNYLKNNSFGIGTKVKLYNRGGIQFKELFQQRGFQSSSQPMLHFGLDSLKTIDSIKIIWPNKTYQTLKNIHTNQNLTVSYENAKPYEYSLLKNQKPQVFKKVEDNLGINYRHTDNNYIDSNRNKLIPYQISDRGPAIALGDINNDGKHDVFFGNGKHVPAEIYLQNNVGFEKYQDEHLQSNALVEESSAIISDFNNDKKNELFIAAGGGEFFGKSKALQNSVYTISETGLETTNILEGYEDTAIIKAVDFDVDGDLDVFVGNASISNDFGKIPESYLLQNDGAAFSKKSLGKVGMVRDAVWTDFNGDNQVDLIIVGEWMSPVFFENNNGNFIDKTNHYLSTHLNGLWRAIIPFDVDNDGDLDYMLGNWGTNTKFKASEKFPMLMYYADFDKNSKTETLLATEKEGKYYTLEGLDELSSQLVSLTKKKFTAYKDFAGKPINQVFDSSVLNEAKVFEVHTLASGILKNNNGKFTFQPYSNQLQVAPINSFVKITVSGKDRVLCAGNYFGVKPYHGRFDGFLGALISSENEIELGNTLGLDFFNKAVTKLTTVTFNNKQYLIAVIHNDDVQIYEIK
ncbi:VCBS repeat-containing protein [Tenacibaculum tangerinum]|uniref:VCBS repeat-containing protein n=1 Tax=Tenacibaculum tangerinum TaxID=3038772 RepID=A0ABY8L3T4_9FLAO|nr:VCBS repeat-containing protein [Tenacibaculum tangerinum]WGH76091.1 VCBS repeat-containing protein [Tenacibaculum tangerinum]